MVHHFLLSDLSSATWTMPGDKGGAQLSRRVLINTQGRGVEHHAVLRPRHVHTHPAVAHVLLYRFGITRQRVAIDASARSLHVQPLALAQGKNSFGGNFFSPAIGTLDPPLG
jgi:hypothetical protein